MTRKIKKILIIRLSAIGDTIHTLPMANALKRNYPDAQIHWIVEDKASFFVEQAKNIDKVFIVPRKKWKQEKNIFKKTNEFSCLMEKLRREKYDIAIDTQQLFKSGLILGLCGAKRRISMSIAREFSHLFANEIIQTPYKLFDSNYHILKRYQEFLEYLDIDDKQTTFDLKDFSQNTFEYAQGLLCEIDKSKPTIIFAPATTWDNKHWAINHWQTLFNHFASKSNIVFTGTQKDTILVEKITENSQEKFINLTGKTNLEQLAQVIKLSDLVISPDSGTAHIAWATEKPATITIFTATAKNRTGPIGERNFSFAPELPCAPCLRRKCRNKSDSEICTKILDPKVIINKIEEILFSKKDNID